jgi:hypothetical protein
LAHALELSGAGITQRYSAERSAFEKLRHVFVWLIFASAFVVIFEPAPTDLFFFLSFAAFIYSGANYTPTIMPFMFLLLVYNLGGIITFALVAPTYEALQYNITSIYMAASGIFLASYLSVDSSRRIENIFSGYIFGAVMAGALALLAFVFVKTIGKTFVSLGANSLITYGRATGLFKDPNVFSTFMVLPCVLLAQRLLLGTAKRPLLTFVFFCIVSSSLVLALSRGAWINLAGSIVTMVALTFFLTQSNALRGRVVLLSLVGVALITVALILLLSSPDMKALFLDRFTLTKNYDSGERGRFGNQLNAIPLLLDRPLGLGPFEFPKIFGENPHNTFIDSFVVGGWLAGVSYFCLFCSNIYVGFRTVITRSPYQNHAILVFSCLVEVMLQGIQIDTEHWRHFYWMMGMMWGLAAATLHYTNSLNSNLVTTPKHNSVVSNWTT